MFRVHANPTDSVFAVLLLALGILGCEAGGGGGAAQSDRGGTLSAEAEQDVQATVKAYVDAFNRADVSSVLGFYARNDRVISVADGEITRGWENLRAGVDSTLMGLGGAFSVALGSIDVVSLGTQHTLAVAPYTLTLQTQQGPVQARGAMSLVLQRADSGWTIVHDHASTAVAQDK